MYFNPNNRANRRRKKNIKVCDEIYIDCLQGENKSFI